MLLKPKQVVVNYNEMFADRSTWEYHWQELADYMMPRKNQITTMRSPGEKRNTHLFDNTGPQSLQLLAGSLHGLLTNPHRVFFEYSLTEKELMDRDEVRAWLQDATDRTHRVLNNTNFQTEVHEMYLDLACFGTGNMFMAEDPKSVIRFKTIPIEQYLIEENNHGFIDTVYRCFKWTAKQIVQEFGEKNVHKEVKDALMMEPNKKMEIIHAVYPVKVKKTSASDLTFFSQYILKDQEHQLRVKKIREFPFAVTRWSKDPREKWGRSPAMNALPETKTINLMVETMIKASQKAIDPALVVPDDGFIFPIRMKPGSINIKRAGSAERIEPVFQTQNIDFGFQALEERRQRIREAFYIDQLKLREADRMTAKEVEQRTEESLRFLGPILGRQESEFLRPMVDRLFGIMFRRGMFKPVPDALQGKDLEVKYTSPVAKAQRMSEARSILRGFDNMAPFFQIDQESVDVVNAEEAVKTIARVHGWPQNLIRRVDEVDQIRDGRAQAQQEAVKQQNAQAEAEIDSKQAAAAAQLQKANQG
jgi:hypothetical protein